MTREIILILERNIKHNAIATRTHIIHLQYIHMYVHIIYNLEVRH